MSLEQPDDRDDGARDCGTFFLDVFGAYSRDQLSIRWSDARPTTSAELRRLVDQAWDQAVDQARKAGQSLFDGRLCRLIDCSRRDRRLDLTLGPVTYKEFVGTNRSQAYLRYLHGSEVLANPLGVSAALTTSDGFLLLGRRSGRVAQYGDRIHPIGGMVEPTRAGGPGDPFQTMLTELLEETGITADSVDEIVLLGLVRDKHTVQPELIFDVRVSADAGAVRRSAAAADDAGEHSALIPLRSHPGAVVTFLEQNFAELTPIALASLLLHGLRHWGSGWFAGARGYLRSVI